MTSPANCITVELKTVTPLFLAGAEPRGEPELRAASLRGALRFWLRALLGGVLGDKDLNALRQAESAVFGSTEMASPVVVRITHCPLKSEPFSALASSKSGVAYLFFAARGTKTERERSAIPANERLQLKLEERVGLGKAEGEVLQWAYAALWLLTHLGGLGSRSRRGAGSLQVTEVIEQPESLKDLPPLTVSAKTPEELAEKLKDGLKRLRQFAGTPQTLPVTAPSTFDVLHPDVCRVWVVNKEFEAWGEALDAFGSAFQQFRSRRKPDYDLVKKALQHQQSTPIDQPIQRAAFGLPIVFYYTSLGGKKATLEGTDHDRRASPLILRITELANSKCVLVLTFFHAWLLPEGEELRLQLKKDQAVSAPIPSFDLIEEFLKEVQTKTAPLLEVTGW